MLANEIMPHYLEQLFIIICWSVAVAVGPSYPIDI